MKSRFWFAAIFTALAPLLAAAADEPKAPSTAKALWADFDPRKDALDAKTVREWEKDGIVNRYVTFHIGTFKGKPTRLAGFVGFPKGAKKLPGLLHLHGGGQRVFLRNSLMMVHELGPTLLTASLFSIALPVGAADFEKYLLDDTAGVLTVNVKQMRTSPAFTNQLQKQAETLLLMGGMQTIFKASGFEPLRDIERITFAEGRSLHPVEGEVKEGTPLIFGTYYFIVQGNLDEARLRTLAERTSKKPAPKVKEHKIGDAPLWELIANGQPLYLAVPEKDTVIISAIRGHVANAIAKAVGKKKAQLRSDAMRELLVRLDLQASASWVAISDCVFGSSVGTFQEVGKKPSGMVRVRHYTLGDESITAAAGSLTVTEEVQFSTTLACKNRATAASIQNYWQEKLKNATTGLEKLTEEDAAKKDDFAQLVAFLRGVRLTSEDQKVTFMGRGTSQVMEILLKLRFRRIT